MYFRSFNLIRNISIGNHLNASAIIMDLHYEWYLKILSKLHGPLGECNLNKFAISLVL